MSMLGHNEASYRLDQMAVEGRRALAKIDKGEADALDGWLAYGHAMNEGRALFPSDEQFGQWVVSSKLEVTHPAEQSAAMWAAANADQFEEARAAGNARTVRGIHAKWKEIEAAAFDDDQAQDHEGEADDEGEDEIVSRAWDRVTNPQPTDSDPDPQPSEPTRASLMREIEAERREKAEAKRAARDQKERDLAEKIRAGAGELSASKKYGVILADPPWRFEPYSRATGMDRAADNHYPTSSTDEITALPVPAADDAVLFLWATAPMLPDALHVMSGWGFTYKSHLIWAKDRIGTGYWARNRHELLLIGTRGSIPAPSPGTQPESLIEEKVGQHSVKPDAFHEMIEGLFPSLPKIEMFARRGRDGWDTWGAEAPEDIKNGDTP